MPWRDAWQLFPLSPLSFLFSIPRSIFQVLPPIERGYGVLLVWFGFLCLGCGSSFSHYAKVDRSLSEGHSEQAVQIIQEAEDDYGKKNRLLFLLDKGMVLHLAGQYAESNTVLEKAHLLVEDFYTKRLREEASALLVNEAELPYEGAPYEHVMINVIKALNFSLLQQWNEALVEGRRIDHRLNVLSDKIGQKDAYREDPFARYIVGLLYEMVGDFNNAYVGYRKSETLYEEDRGWTRVPLPETLKKDLIRMATALGVKDDVETYRLKYPEVTDEFQPTSPSNLAQVVVISYQGKGPKKEDLTIDVPVSLDALALVALTKPGFGRSSRTTRSGQALLYGIHGRIARISLPRFSMQKSTESYDAIQIKSTTTTIDARSESMYDVQAVAEKTLADEYDSLVLRAVARTAMKMAAAEGIGIGAGALMGGNNRNWIGPLVGGIARIFALATEEADTRIWRTLPGKIQLTRIWLEPGEYSITIRAMDHNGQDVGTSRDERLQLKDGETRFFLHQSFR